MLREQGVGELLADQARQSLDAALDQARVELAHAHEAARDKN